MIAPRGNDMVDISSDSKLQSMSMDTDDDLANGGDSGISELLDWNGLTYTFPVTNSVVSARNLKIYPSVGNQYTNAANMEFRVATGAQYVDFRKSALSFKLTVNLTAKVDVTIGSGETIDFWPTFGGGSVMNLFRSIVVSSRSGAELMRIEKFNVFRPNKDYMVRDKIWFDSVGSSLFYNKDLKTRGDFIANASRIAPFSPDSVQLPNDAAAGSTQTKAFELDVLIPMYMFDGLFDVDQLAPSFLVSGMRLELQLADPKTAITVHWVDNGTGKWSPTTTKPTKASISSCTTTIDTPRLLLDTHILNDASTIELKRVSAQNGLEYTYKGIHSQPENMLSSTQVNPSVTRAVSRALNCFAVNGRSLGTDAFIDYFAPPTSKVTKYQMRLGSQYYPHQQLTTAAQQFWNVLYCYDQLDSSPAVDLKGHTDKLKTVCASFERSSLLRFSGAPLNNSRALSLDVTFDEYKTGYDQLYIFLEYVQLAKTYLNNVIVTM